MRFWSVSRTPSSPTRGFRGFTNRLPLGVSSVFFHANRCVRRGSLNQIRGFNHLRRLKLSGGPTRRRLAVRQNDWLRERPRSPARYEDRERLVAGGKERRTRPRTEQRGDAVTVAPVKQWTQRMRDGRSANRLPRHAGTRQLSCLRRGK